MPTEAHVTRGFVDVGSDRQVHYYRSGSGAPVLMMHPSPSSGAALLPLLERIAPFVTAIAIDTPGYGFSDSLDSEIVDIGPYVQSLERVRIQFGFDNVVVYGSATGSQIALEYARTFPDACRGIVLDNMADFRPDEREDMLAGYFPDLAVDSGAGHLARIWTTALNLFRFFPWHWNQRPETRLPSRAVDVVLIQKVALQYLQAGPGYDNAYRVAFANEHAERLQTIAAAATVIRSSGSIVHRYAERFDNYQWPDNVLITDCGPTPEERLAAAADAIQGYSKGMASAKPHSQQSDTGRRICAHRAGSIAVLRAGRPGDTWLVLHDIGESFVAVENVIRSLSIASRVIAPDLPGHGGSDEFFGEDQSFVASCCEALTVVLDDDAVDSVNVLACGASAQVALAFAAAQEQRVEKICLVNPVFEIEPLFVTPVLDGSHLIVLWHALINTQLYERRDEWSAESALSGVPDIGPERINRALIDRLLSDSVYDRAVEEINNLPNPMLDHCTIAVIEGTTAADRSRRAMRRLGRSNLLALAADPADWEL